MKKKIKHLCENATTKAWRVKCPHCHWEHWLYLPRQKELAIKAPCICLNCNRDTTGTIRILKNQKEKKGEAA
jgi:hypothetical protein